MSTYQHHQQFDRRFQNQQATNGYYTFYPQLPAENPDSLLNPFQSSNHQPIEYQPFLAQDANGYSSINSEHDANATRRNGNRDRRSNTNNNSNEISNEEDDSASGVLKVSMGHFLVILLHCIVLAIILTGYYFQYVTLTSIFIAITLLSAYFVIPITCTGFVVVPGVATSIICIFISIAMCAVFLSDPLWRISYFDNYLKGVEDVRVTDIPKLYEPRVHPPAEPETKEQLNEYFRWRNGKIDFAHYGVLEKPNVDRYYFVVPLVDENFDPEHDSVQVVLAKTIYNKVPLSDVFDLELQEGWRVSNSALNRWDLFTDRNKYYQKAVGNMKTKFEGQIRFAHNLIVLEQQEQSLKDMYTFYHQLCRIGVILVGIILVIQLLCMIAEVSFRFGISIGLLRRQEAAESS